MTADVWFSALQSCLQPSVLLFLAIGVCIGTIIGALPGLSATMGIAIMTPITFWFAPSDGFAMLMGLWNAAIFAGGISAILVNTPGTPASICQAFDGYNLYRQGKGGLALGINVIYSFIGGIFSTFCLILFSTPIARFTISFNAPEYCMLALFGLSMMVAGSVGPAPPAPPPGCGPRSGGDTAWPGGGRCPAGRRSGPVPPQQSVGGGRRAPAGAGRWTCPPPPPPDPEAAPSAGWPSP